jgi:hypothetical protein
LVVRDSRTSSLLQSRLPPALSSRILTTFAVPGEPVRVQEGRYVWFSTCLERSCRTESLFWLDAERGVGLGAHFDATTGVLALGSNGLSGREFPDRAREALMVWISSRLVEAPEPGFGVAATFQETVRRVEFVDVNGRTTELDRAGFAPPRFEPPPGGPAFPCAGADSSIEIAVCADTELSRLDLQMLQQFLELRGRSSATRYQEALVDFQRAWIVRRDLACARMTDPRVCLRAQYRDQAERLRSWTPD